MWFHTALTGLEQREGRLTGVRYRKENGKTGLLETSSLILAIGHSARDTFQALYDGGLPMEAKSFSVGARIEHPQLLIDKAPVRGLCRASGLGGGGL